MHDSKGVTLIELLIYLAIFSGMVFALFQVFIAFTHDRGSIEARVEVQQNIRFATETMVQAVHRAIGTNNSTTTSSTTLSLVMQDASKNPTIFDVLGNILRIKEGAGSAVNITSDLTNVTNFTVTRITNTTTTAGTTSDTIKMDLTIEYKNNQKPNLKFSQNIITSAAIKK